MTPQEARFEAWAISENRAVRLSTGEFRWGLTVGTTLFDAYQAGAADALNTLMRQLAWSPAPQSVQWGGGMMAADVALSKDETLTLYAHKDALAAAPEYAP